MRNVQRKGIMLGAGLLGAIVLGGFAGTASAKSNKAERKDVKDARKEVREARKDVRQADTYRERRREERDLREAQEKLRRERADVQRRNGNNRYNGNRYNTNNRYNNRYNNNRYNNRNDDRYRGRYYNGNVNRTFEGIVVRDTRSNSFVLRTRNGQTLNVRAINGEPRRLDRGDIVRVYGTYTGSIFRASNVNIVRNR